jgi:hypothetical protein
MMCVLVWKNGIVVSKSTEKDAEEEVTATKKTQEHRKSKKKNEITKDDDSKICRFYVSTNPFYRMK